MSDQFDKLILEIHGLGFDRVSISNEFSLEPEGVPLNDVREEFLEDELRFQDKDVSEVPILLGFKRHH